MKTPKPSDILKFNFAAFILMAYPFSIKKLGRAIGFYFRFPKIITNTLSDSPEHRQDMERYTSDNNDSVWGENFEKSLRQKNWLVQKIMFWARDETQYFQPILKEFITRFDYVNVTFIWYTRLFFALKNGDVFVAFQKLVEQVISGERSPYKINLQLQKQTRSDLTNYLRASDAEGASTLLEENSESFKLDSGTAAIHLILRGEGTYVLINYPTGKRKILLVPELSREAVIKILKGWIWLYFWYRGDLREELTLEAMEMWTRNIKERPKSQLESARDYVLYYIYNPILNNSKIFDEYRLIEIPEGNKGTPYLAPPVWVLSDIYLRMLGNGYSWCTPGLWQQIHSEIKEQGIHRLIISPDPALAIFPHHAAVLEINSIGKRTYLQDHYEVAYVPWGNLSIKQSYMPKGFIAFGDPSVDLSNCFINNVSTSNPDKIFQVAANKDQIEKAIGQSNGFLYFGHAAYNWNDPLSSHINLNGRALQFKNLAKLIQKDLDLVVMASCDAGIPISNDFSFEYDNTSTYLIRAFKCNSIISSSWGANPLSTFLLFRQFYKLFLPKLKNGDSVANAACNALSASQHWLRNASKESLISEMEEVLNAARETDEKEIKKGIEWLSKQYIHKPFAHPYFWSSFYFIGRPS